ncbi:MAG: hypothetical protein U1D69_14315 [Polynucleobacter sp.]|uniref:hypothetical protein n=1 Tax=Limnobacter sp. TaxID=2003368 RepID=UPI002735F002|nr:hypothetical protein [Limnobacter sp.]MDP3270232.1 hypothetical protein [Limnobacter sp.]MDZ4058105.1 hypothetical protein [Polynucleobacter sp.]
MINFPGKITIEACEKAIAQMINGETTGDLHLPVGTAGYANSFGGLATAIQAVNTWARLSETRKLELSQRAASDEIEDIIKRPHKFVAAMFAKSISRTNQTECDLRLQINAAAKQAIEQQARSQLGQQRGGLCWFAFVDHSSMGFDPNFYIAKTGAIPEPRQPEQFKALIQKMISKAIAAPGGGRDIHANDLDALGRIFYELFLNTHEHGSRDRRRSVWLKPGVRIIYVQGINLRKSSVLSTIENQPVISNYLSAVENYFPSERQHRFIEISIIDSGLGFYDRWMADQNPGESLSQLSIKKEYEIFRKCFNFRQTSTLKDSKGNGLPVVMHRLTKLGGFMRIRSGQLCLFRNFISSPYSSSEPCTFFDWKTGRSAETAVTLLPKACGVAISLLIPLEAK